MTALAGGKEFEVGEYLEQTSAVQAACPWYMPCGFDNWRDNMPAFFAGDINDEKYRSYVNPLSYVTEKAPPFLLLHGTEDKDVPFEHSEIIYNALLKKGIEAHLVGLTGEGHAGPQFFQRPLWDIIASFFKEKLG
jgi:dipeptidyl aminopeptidase/acylaminoacyl peptidase